ncbi:MAG: hypothetical protein ACYCUF_11460 [Acidimicrobiales bacterium]|jgi:hypothetical protein|nr:hypothetical protein [Actinomycetota bacterium]
MAGTAARVVAVWLNDAGHRTKAIRPWRDLAVRIVLRIRVCVGKVFLRDALHDGRPRDPRRRS